MSECPHKQLKKQMVGEQVWYICECGQKFRIEAWDGKVSVLALPDPRKDLAALEELVASWRSRADLNTKAAKGVIAMATTKAALQEAAKTLIECAARLEQRLAEMRGAKR
jgi:hypothetical protein